jgi:hypothetical protein
MREKGMLILEIQKMCCKENSGEINCSSFVLFTVVVAFNRNPLKFFDGTSLVWSED